MKMIKFPAISALAIGVALAAATRVRAADAHYLELTRPMVVARVNLRAGVYKIQWELEGTQANVTFSRKDRVVATVHGVYSTSNKSVTCDTLYTAKHPDGSIAIIAFGIAGSDKAIVFPAYRSHPLPAMNTQVVTGMVQGSWVSPQQSRPLVTK
ncbi:MAG TPA: hypothetical protein VKO18_20180 [Terriglobia bacterium]|nr:hypothetical protein [Terriglobia bacterium]